MQKKRLRRIGIFILFAIILVISIPVYLFFKPHRNVQTTDAFAEIQVGEITNEFTTNTSLANAKYLASDGNSKVLIVQGRINSISTDQANEKVVQLKEIGAKVGVSCTFSLHANSHLKDIKIGDIIKIKGAITAGNAYDADLDLYNDAILVQCDIINK